jgi:hypothetical protein
MIGILNLPVAGVQPDAPRPWLYLSSTRARSEKPALVRFTDILKWIDTQPMVRKEFALKLKSS